MWRRKNDNDWKSDKKVCGARKTSNIFLTSARIYQQTSKTFTALGIEHGIISAGTKIKVSQDDRNKPDF